MAFRHTSNCSSERSSGTFTVASIEGPSTIILLRVRQTHSAFARIRVASSPYVVPNATRRSTICVWTRSHSYGVKDPTSILGLITHFAFVGARRIDTRLVRHFPPTSADAPPDPEVAQVRGGWELVAVARCR